MKKDLTSTAPWSPTLSALGLTSNLETSSTAQPGCLTSNSTNFLFPILLPPRCPWFLPKPQILRLALPSAESALSKSILSLILDGTYSESTKFILDSTFFIKIWYIQPFLFCRSLVFFWALWSQISGLDSAHQFGWADRLFESFLWRRQGSNWTYPWSTVFGCCACITLR